MSCCVIVCLILMCIHFANAYELLNLKNPTTKYGFVYPNRAEPNSNVTYVLEGVDVLIYIVKLLDNYAACEITTPDAEITYSLIANGNGNDDNSKVEFWTPNPKEILCGARIKNVKVSDSGRWRLKAVTAEEDHLYQSFINLKVIKNFERLDGDFIIREGPFDEFNMTQYASYCDILEPTLLGEQKIFDKCQIDLQNINKLYDTKWKAKVGVLGKIDEITLQPKVEVLREYFDVGFNSTKINGKTKINLFCNLRNAIDTNVTFCRFTKDKTDFGLKLSEGLSNGNYSYFGHILKNGDCGVTIENPQQNDYVLWKCSLGVHRRIDKTEIIYEVKESIISLTKSTKNKSKRSLRAIEIEIKTKAEVLAGLENPLVLSHETDFPIKYCIIKHPNGTQYAINGPFHNNYWSTYGDINTGKCEMKIFNTTQNETGLWKMQIGRQYETQFMDEIVHIPVRVGENAMVAENKTVEIGQDSQLTLKCKAVANQPNILEYCRFTLPDGSGFQINEKITEDESINGLYWYNGTSLTEGDCQVTIKEISSEHYGEWYCSGKIQGSKNLEDFDTIYIESGQLSVASISGIAVGVAIILIGSVGGFIYYRKRRQQPKRRSTYLSASARSSNSDVAVFDRDLPLVSAEARQAQEVVVEEIEMSNISRAQSRTSAHSGPATSAHSGLSTSAHSGLSTSAQSRPQSRVSESARSVISAQSAISARSRPSTSAQSRPSSSASIPQQEGTQF